MKKQFLLFFLLILVITACNPVEVPSLPNEPLSSTATPPVNITQTKSEEENAQMSQPASPSGMEFLIEKAKDDLAQQLSIPVDQIELKRAEAVTWPDASLGCPQPGMAYAEVLTSGYLILLEANNKEYEYHTSRGTEIIYCENPNPPVPGTPDDI